MSPSNPMVVDRLAHEAAAGSVESLHLYRGSNFDNYFVAFSKTDGPVLTEVQEKLYVGERLGGMTSTLVEIPELSDDNRKVMRYLAANGLKFSYYLARYNPMTQRRSPSHTFLVPKWAGRSDLAAVIYSRGVLSNWSSYRDNETELCYMQLDANDVPVDLLWVVKPREQTWEATMLSASAVHDH